MFALLIHQTYATRLKMVPYSVTENAACS